MVLEFLSDFFVETSWETVKFSRQTFCVKSTSSHLQGYSSSWLWRFPGGGGEQRLKPCAALPCLAKGQDRRVGIPLFLTFWSDSKGQS